MTNERREFMAAGLIILAATLSERLGAAGAETRVEGLIDGQQPAPASTNASRAVATKDAPKVNLDGWQMTATEITIPPGAPPGRKHRHPGFVIGYVLEGQYSFAVNDRAPQVISAGQMFFESFDAPGEVHSASGNASATQPVKFLAIVFHKKGDPVTIPG
jgi:quercetin dioxygenase-like cupin family protein